MTISRTSWLATASVSALVLGWSPQAAAVEIGTVAAANPTIDGTPPDRADARRLTLGDRVIANERIATSDDGSGQLIFLDQTALIVSPGSDIVLDRYVFDPDAGAGEIALTLSKGVMRFIGGRITKSAEATIRTPHATIGLRGAIAAFTVDDSGTKATLIAGESLTIASPSGTLTLSRNNATAEVPADGGAPQYTGLADLTEIASLYSAGGESAGGGATQPITSGDADGAATAAGMDGSGANSPGATTAPQISTLGEEPAATAISEPVEVREAGETAITENPEVVGGGGNGGGGGGPAPIVGLNGLAFVAPTTGFVTFFGNTVDDPFATGNVFSPDGPIAFEAVFEGSRRGRTAEGADYVIPTPATTGFFNFGDLFEAPDIAENGSTPLGAIGGQGFYDVEEDFLLAAFATLGETPRLGVTMMGIPTPGQLDATFGEEITARRYVIGPNIINGAESGLPPIFGIDINSAQDEDYLYLIPGPEQRFLGDDRTQIGYESESRAKFMFASLAIEGEGGAQNSLLIVHYADALPNEIFAPTSSDTFRSFYNLGADDIVGRGFINVGTIADPEGHTVFGADGDYFAFGNAAQFYGGGANPDLEIEASNYTYFDRSILTPDVDREAESEGQVYGVYGTFRGAEFDSEEFVGGFSARTPLAPAVAATGLDPVGTFTNAFTGGYAAGQAQSRIVTAPDIEDVLPAPYVLRSHSADSVLAAFNTLNNAVAFEFADLDAVGEGGRSDLFVAFGDDFGWSAFLHDDAFTAAAPRDGVGAITGQETSFDGSSGNPDRAFNGALTTSGLVGDGGIFPEGVDTSPEYLRWGWWGGDFRFTDSENEGDKRFGREMISLGTWVAGDRTDILDLGQQGVARFEGLAVAHVTEVGGALGLNDTYVDGGGYEMVFDFAERSGTATITGIADSTFFAYVSENGAAPGNHYGGVLYNSFEDQVGAIDGSFFTGGGDPTAATAGAFDFTQDGALGSTVTGAGIFAADKVPD